MKLGAGGRISGLEKRQRCPKAERLAKDIWTVKCCRCNEAMLQAKGDLEELIRNAGGDRSGCDCLGRNVRSRQGGWSESVSVQ